MSVAARRWLSSGRQAAGKYGWALQAAVVLALFSIVEALARLEYYPNPVFALLVGLSTTVPLAFARRHAVLAALAIAVSTALTVTPNLRPTITGLASLACVLLLLAGRGLRRVRARNAEHDTSLQAVETSLLEITARGERARIARDLHDVVAHHISMISVQAETARLTTPGMPDEGAERLLAIGDTARAALTEMRRLLGVLREDAGEQPARVPQPGLHQILDLIDEAREASGGSVRLIVQGGITGLDPGVELAAYRVIQEALTNARRHARGAAVDVEVRQADDALRLRVRDNGPGPPPSAGRGGHGLLGMRERVATVGGELRTGTAPTGGFLVEAVLPVAGRIETGATR